MAWLNEIAQIELKQRISEKSSHGWLDNCAHDESSSQNHDGLYLGFEISKNSGRGAWVVGVVVRGTGQDQWLLIMEPKFDPADRGEIEVCYCTT